MFAETCQREREREREFIRHAQQQVNKYNNHTDNRALAGYQKSQRLIDAGRL